MVDRRLFLREQFYGPFKTAHARNLIRPHQRAQPIAIIVIGEIGRVEFEADASSDTWRYIERRHVFAAQLAIDHQRRIRGDACGDRTLARESRAVAIPDHVQTRTRSNFDQMQRRIAFFCQCAKTRMKNGRPADFVCVGDARFDEMRNLVVMKMTKSLNNGNGSSPSGGGVPRSR